MRFATATVFRSASYAAALALGLASPRAAHAAGPDEPAPTASESKPALALGASAAGETADTVEEVFWRADEQFSRGDYAQAAVLFTRALELSRQPNVPETWRDFSPKIAFNIAQSFRRAGHCQAAQMAYAHYAGLTSPLPGEHVAWYDELLTECPELRGTAATPTNVSPDERSAAASDSARSSTPEASGPWTMDVNLPRPVGAADSSKVWRWGTAAGAVVALAGSVGFYLSGNEQHEKAQKQRLWADAEPYDDAARTRWVTSGALAAVGLALGGVSVYLFTQSSASEAGNQAVVLRTLGLRSNGTTLHLSGEF